MVMDGHAVGLWSRASADKVVQFTPNASSTGSEAGGQAPAHAAYVHDERKCDTLKHLPSQFILWSF